MQLIKRIESYHNMFETKTRDNGESFVCMSDKASKELHDSVMEAHNNQLPNDWTYSTYESILSSMSNYDIKTVEDLEENRSEIVDSLVDVYTSDLTAWLNSNNYNVEYLTEAMKEWEPEDGFRLLAMAQYMAIDEIYGYVLSLLEG